MKRGHFPNILYANTSMPILITIVSVVQFLCSETNNPEYWKIYKYPMYLYNNLLHTSIAVYPYVTVISFVMYLTILWYTIIYTYCQTYVNNEHRIYVCIITLSFSQIAYTTISKHQNTVSSRYCPWSFCFIEYINVYC